MAYLPDTHRVPVIRADFSDDALWAQLQEEISKETEKGFGANVEFVEDPRLAGLDVPALVRAFPRAYPHEYNHPVVFVVDAVTVSSPEHPILAIGLNERDAAEPFRVVPGELDSIETNLLISNVDFSEFARAAHRSGGVYRG
ncbi:hypothetical protein AB0880_19750 [Micromonospora chersina]|uniref:DUF6924 domain-containing protein n=1 Tax=Micromonospora kangleipakensis TaxID=1077942 RepID=A0A4Q8B2N0_9ACTN|nr:hypothetical protein [Micromonospora kangleipakensis]RZU71730.1 hypothetical protein EV384_0060 [Micromonospora kangleipakensis]